MEDNLVNGTVDYWGAEAQSPKQELYPLTPEEEDALWADPVYGPRSGGDEDWEADQPTGTRSRSSDSFTLKYMDEEKTVSREEVVTLAQKGMDYDRVRRRLEETGSALKEYEQIRGQLGLRGEQLRWMDELAKEQGLSLDTILEETHAKLLPQEKLEKLQQIRQKRGSVMFVGDGINDAPVLAGADVGAAMGSGADAAIEAADVVFMTSDVKAIPEALKIARRTGKIARQNVIFALVVKFAVMVLGLLGHASMWMAVFADSGVAMLCVLNSIRILYKKK